MTSKKSLKWNALKTWSISYFMIFVIPLLFFIVFITVSIEMLRTEVEHYNQMAVVHVGSTLDNVFAEVNSIAETILVGNQFSEVLLADDPISISTYTLFQNVTNLSRAIEDGNEGFFLYSPSRDFFLGANSFGRLSALETVNSFNLGNGNRGISSAFRKQLDRMEIYDVSYTYLSGVEVRRFLVMRPLSYLSSGIYSDWCIAYIVNLNRIIGRGNINDDRFSAYYDLMIFRRQDESFIYALSGVSPDEDEIESILSGKELPDAIVASAPSAETNFTYVIKIDKNEYFHTIYMMRFMTILYIAFTLIFGIFFLTRKVRKSWTELDTAIKEAGADADAAESIYSPFVSSMTKLEKEKEGLSIVMSAQAATLKENMIERLLSSSDASIISENALSECGIEFKSDIFFVLLSRLGDENIEQMLSERFQSSSIQVFPFSQASGLSCIINIPSEIEDPYALIEEVVSSISIDGVSLSSVAAASDAVIGIRNIGQAYIDAINTLDYKSNNSIQDFIFSRDVTAMSSRIRYALPNESANELQMAIQEGRGDDALLIVRRIFTENQDNGVPPRHLRYLLMAISNLVMKTSMQLESLYGSDLPPFKPPQILEARRSIESIRMTLEDKIYAYTEKVLEVHNAIGDVQKETYVIYQRALKEIASRYSDPSLNVSEIADRLSVTLAYLSKIFKKYHMMNISDYISRYRVDMAKSMLAEGMQISDVAISCGFGSLRTFMRVFRKIEGVTPGQYRLINMEES